MRQLLLSISAVLSLTFAAHAGELRAGAATSNITPPLGSPIIGGFAPFPSTHVHDELHARCLVLDDGSTKLALVVCDLLGIHRLVSDEARRLIEKQTGIPPARVLISARTRTRPQSALGQDRFKHEQELDDYQRFVAQRIADGVQRAANTLRPAEIGFGTAEAPEHVFNRRWFMQPGTMPANPFGTTRPGEDESARRQPEPDRAGRADRSDRLVHRRPRARRPADLGLFGLFAALRRRRRHRTHLGRLLRHVLRAPRPAC